MAGCFDGLSMLSGLGGKGGGGGGGFPLSGMLQTAMRQARSGSMGAAGSNNSGTVDAATIASQLSDAIQKTKTGTNNNSNVTTPTINPQQLNDFIKRLQVLTSATKKGGGYGGYSGINGQSGIDRIG